MSNWFDRAKRLLQSRSLSLAGTHAADRSSPYRRLFAFETLEPRLALAAAGLVTTPQTYSGTLSGKIVYTFPGHGFYVVGGTWETQRPDYWQQFSGSTETADGELVEDFGNEDEFSLYNDDLLRAGATVVPMKPVGRQVNEVVLDNEFAEAGKAQPSLGTVTFTGTWGNSTQTTYYDEDYGAVPDTVPYKFAATTTGAATAFATYIPNIPAAGFYPVYTWVHLGTDRTSQLYTINHTDGQTQIRVDHSMVGDGWVYLGTYHFDTGSSVTEGSVVISNQASATGKNVIADAIRFGNGMGDVPWGSSGIGTGSISGQPREDEAAILWEWRALGQGANPASVFDTANVFTAPEIMAARMNADTNPFGTSLLIGIHSNGSTGNITTATSRGALGLYRSSSNGNSTPNQLALATDLGTEINTQLQALNGQFEFNWSNPSANVESGAFGEISNAYLHGEMDASIAEVAYHDNQQDNALLRDPKVREQIARTVYEATVEYFNTYGGTANTAVPSAPTNVSAVSNASGQVTISWVAGPSSVGGVTGPYGDVATGYRIYASTDGYGFDGGTLIAGGATTTATLSGYDPNTPYYFKVVAVNAGGESDGSEVVTALPSGGPKQVLIVNGFDRFDRTQDFLYPYTQSGYANPDPDGITDRVWPTYNNSHNYVIQVASAIQVAAPGIHFASASNEAVISGAVNLSDYSTVIWILGNESTANHTFDATEQAKVTSFINGGGNLFVSGSEIGWDLDQQNNGRSFYETTLKGNFVADDANTYSVTAAAGGIFDGMSGMFFSNGSAFSQIDGQMYNVATPDVIAPQAGAASALTYSGGTGGTAAIQVAGTGGKGSIVMFGFPFETITSAVSRAMIIDKVFDFFNIAPPNPDLNRNGTVDAGDYVLWRKTQNTSVTAGTAGDADGNGKVNDADYQFWRGRFGSPPEAGSGSSLAAPAGAAEAATSSESPPDSGSPVNQFAAVDSIVASDSSVDNNKVITRSDATGQTVQPDWTELLNELAERSIRRGASQDETATDQSALAKDAGRHERLSQIGCSFSSPMGQEISRSLTV